jgi:hypothetical protein
MAPTDVLGDLQPFGEAHEVPSRWTTRGRRIDDAVWGKL